MCWAIPRHLPTSAKLTRRMRAAMLSAAWMQSASCGSEQP